MNTKLILCCYAASVLALGAQEQPRSLVQNPKLLKPPVALLRAEMRADMTTATLQDTNGVQLEFTCSMANDRLAVRASVTNAEWALPPASFSGWKLEDLALVVEDTIKREFVWDSERKALRPKNPEDFANLDKAQQMFTGNAAKRLLRWAELRLQRKATYMQ
jgi:hypothetical protein